jgi:modulator of FtsH protease
VLSEWNTFFQGELGAAAALAGLLFVAMSVNQARILALGRTADRGLEALAILFLVMIVASLPLIPGQPLRMLGAEILILGMVALLATVLLQRIYMSAIEEAYRSASSKMVMTNRVAVAAIALAGLLLLWRGDIDGIYLLPFGILLSFFAAGASAWVLLVEINR